MRKSNTFSLDDSGFEQAMEFIHQFLVDNRIGKERVNAMLVLEEALGCLRDHKTDGDVHIRTRSLLGSVILELSAAGEAFSLAENMKSVELPKDDEIDGDVQEVIRTILLKSLTDDLKYRHRDGVNYIRVTLVKSKQAFLWHTLSAMMAAIVIGLILTFAAPGTFNSALDTNLLAPVKTMYMNALKMIVAPVVFFSIVSCIMQFSDLSALGRIGGKTLGLYFCTTLIAVCVGFGAFYLFQPGNISMMQGLAADASSITSRTMPVSVRDTIMDIVPSNFVDPFLKSNMLQLIFLAVICGVATGLIGKYSAMLMDFFHACNDLFLKITMLIIRVMPVAVFCSIASMILTMGIGTIISVLGMFGTFLFGLACMMAVYCLLMLILAWLNPIPFLRKYAPVMLQVFSMSSSNASIPINMNACEKKLGISKKVFSMSIPLGATLNMDGSCVYLAVFALALAKIYGVPVTGAMLLSVAVSIVVLSIGAPGVAGAGLICLSVLLTQMNVPLEAVGLIMGMDSLITMFRVMSNCLGDVAVTCIVARSEGEMNMKIYHEK